MKEIQKVTIDLSKKFTILLFFICIISCSRDKSFLNEKKENVIIAGEITNYKDYPDDYLIKIIIYDLTLGEQRNEVTVLNNDGTFSLEFKKRFPQDIYLKYGKKLITLFVHPGDSLYLQFDANEFIKPNPHHRYSSIKFSGDAQRINQEISAFLPKIHEKYDGSKHNEIVKDYSSSEFKEYINSLRAQRKEILDAFIYNNSTSEGFIEWANYYIDYDASQELLRYLWYHSMLNGTNPNELELAQDYCDFYNLIPIDNEAASICTKYGWFLHEYFFTEWKKVRNANREAFSKKERNRVAESKIIINHAANNIEGFPLELMITQVLNSLLNNTKDIDGFEELFPLYKTFIINTSFINSLNDNYTSLKLREQTDEEYGFTYYKRGSIKNDKKDIISHIVETNVGKILYVDFWATWCGPCISEFQYSKKIQKKLKDKNIAFVYLCVNSSKEKWEDAIYQHKLDGQNFLLNDSQFGWLSDKFQISGIPHYVLIGPDGRVFNDNAPRPSNEAELLKEIDALTTDLTSH